MVVGADHLTVIGFCLGGTLAAIYATIAEEPIKNLVLLTTPIDFSKAPVLDKWAEALNNGTLEPDLIIDSMGLVPASIIRAGMRLVTSPIYISQQFSLLQKSYDECYVERWRRFNIWAEGQYPIARRNS